MDAIGASCYSLHVDPAKLEQKNTHDQFSELIVSCRSLSRYESKSFKALFPQIIATAISASFHIVVGIALGYSAILIPMLEADDSEIKSTKTQSSWIASIILLVVPIGAIIGGFVMDSIGRLHTLKLCTLPVIAGWITIALSNNITMILIGRALTGTVCAFGTSPAIVYITEIAHADIRGSLISSAPALASLGMVLAYALGWFLHWRTVAWIAVMFTIAPCIMIMTLIPESPAWLVSKGRTDDAKKSLEWLNKNQPQATEKQQSLADMQLELLVKENEQKKAEAAKGQGSDARKKLKEFFKPTGYKPLSILFGLFFFQQFAGIYITLFYSVTFFIEMGSTLNPYLTSVLVGAVRFIMSMVSTYLLKNYGRRPLIMISSVGMAICMGFGGLFTHLIKTEQTTQTWIPAGFLILYVMASMIGFLPVPWTMTAELFPLEIRGVCHSISYSFANGLMFVALQSYRPLDSLLGGAHAIQWFFAVTSLLGGLYTFVFLPETHGKKLNDIQGYFMTNTVHLGYKEPEKKPATKRTPIIKNRATQQDVRMEHEAKENLVV